MLARYDQFNFFRARPDSVASDFASKQVEEMTKSALVIVFSLVLVVVAPLLCKFVCS